MDIKGLKRDAARAEAGQWVDHIPNMGTLRLKVRGLGSAAYAQAVARRVKAADRTQRDRDGSVRSDVMRQIIGAAAHETILIDWDGLTSDGHPFPYDAEVARKWLIEPDYEPFRDAVLWAANVVDNDRAEFQGDLVKN